MLLTTQIILQMNLVMHYTNILTKVLAIFTFFPH